MVHAKRLVQRPFLNSNRMKITAYQSVDEARFGDDLVDVQRVLGSPTTRRRNNKGELELVYDRMVVRISEDDGLVECSAQPDVIELEGETILRRDVAAFLRDRDTHAKDVLGFVISPKFGIAVDVEPDHGEWIVIFTRGRWDTFIENP